MAVLRGKYRLGARIGGGGMAEVYEGAIIGAAGFERPVAIKRMLPSLSADPSFGDMFVNEGRIASFLHHPNVVSVLDFDRDEEGRYFLVMELVRGVDLRRLATTGPLPPGAIAFIGAEVLHGLAYAHELEHGGRHLGIVHRDVSPHNVMIAWDGTVKVVDFGIAKAVAATGASRSGTLKGKLAYMSPEQVHGKELDGRSDLFAVGVMLHELLTGHRLFLGATEPEVLARVLNQPIAPPGQLRRDTPPDIERAVMRLLERDRKARFLTAHDAMEALLSCQSVSPRGNLELRQLLGERFPGEAPVRRAESEPSFLLQTTTATDRQAPVVVPLAAVAPPGATMTAPSGPSARRAAAAADTASIGRSGALWIGGAAILAVAAIITALLVAGGGGSGRSDAGVPLAVTEPGTEGDAAATAAGPTADAAPVGESSPEPAAEPEREPPARRTGSVRPGGAAARKPAGPPDAAPAVAAEPGFLRVKVRPWANVYVDGVNHGVTPVRVELTPGSHEVALVNPETGRRESFTVEIQVARTHWIERDWTE